MGAHLERRWHGAESPTIIFSDENVETCSRMWRILQRIESWFRGRADDFNGFRAFLAAVLVAIVLTTQLGGFLWFLSERMTGTLTRDNPDRPPDWVCDGDSPDLFTEVTGTHVGCGEPKRETVEVGRVFWNYASDQLFPLLAGLLLLWLLAGVAIHLLVGGLGSNGTLGQTLEVVAWSGIVELITVALSVAVLVVELQSLTLSAADPQALLSSVRSLTSGPLGLVVRTVQLGGTVVQATVLFAGLVAVHDVDRGRVAIVAGVFAIVLALSVLT